MKQQTPHKVLSDGSFLCISEDTRPTRACFINEDNRATPEFCFQCSCSLSNALCGICDTIIHVLGRHSTVRVKPMRQFPKKNILPEQAEGYTLYSVFSAKLKVEIYEQFQSIFVLLFCEEPHCQKMLVMKRVAIVRKFL